ncbi:MAG: M6 family metalloprotease domain-containing protein [Thermoproteota archaeon]
MTLFLVLFWMVLPVAGYDFSMKKDLTGSRRVVVIGVEFPDQKASTPIHEIEERVFSAMDAYYQNVSYGKMSITGKISETWHLLPHNMSYYGSYSGGNSSDEIHSKGATELIRDAIQVTDGLIDFSGFDYVLVVHAGEDEASSQNLTDLWSWGFWEGLSVSTEDGVTFNQGAIISESDSLGVFCHEFGHVLGLPDLYNEDYNSPISFVGDWGLMGHGCHNGDPKGSTPSHMLSWGKTFLNWINRSQIMEIGTHGHGITVFSPDGRHFKIMDNGVNVTVDPLEKPLTRRSFTATPAPDESHYRIEMYKGVKVIKIPVTSKSYYLIEVRIDKNLPEQGVLVTFVNETRGSGEGIIQVIDANSSTKTLDDALYHVGEVFEERQQHFTVKVIQKLENSSFVVYISNKLVPLRRSNSAQEDYTPPRSPNKSPHN